MLVEVVYVVISSLKVVMTIYNTQYADVFDKIKYELSI